MHILLHRPTPWQSDIFCSTKIYAKQFKMAGYNVSYLESPMDFGHLLKWKGYYHVWRKAPRWEDGIWIINPFTLIPVRDYVLLRSQLAIDASYYWSVPRIKTLLKRSGQGAPDVIWAARPGSSVLKEIFPKATLVMQVVDYYPAFRGDYIKSIEKKDYERADHIFLIGHAMLDYLVHELKVPRDKITVLGQGVSLEQYEQKLEEPEDLKEIPGPRAIWVGVLGKGDRLLFEAAARSLYELGGSLVLVGPETHWAKLLQDRFDNVYLLGSKSPKIVPAYLTHSDVGLMLYARDRTNVYQGQNPLKLYEYAAAGLPIISTPHEEFRYLGPPVIEVRLPGEVSIALNRALNDRIKLRQAALDFAKQNSWHSCFNRAEEIILSHVNPKC